MESDVVLIHPPAIYTYPEKPVFPGPVAYTVGASTWQFITPSIGILSIAEYLSRNGYDARVDNIGERMISNPEFNPEEHLANLSPRVFGIGLHWCVHSQGAIEIARVCKRLHPDAMVLLGGLTASVFHEEIIRKYDFIDVVIRGEAEKPFVELMGALEQGQGLGAVPNLVFREAGGEIKSTPLMEPSADLDEFEFTRLDLLEPNRAIFTPGAFACWAIPISRGCNHNCVGCGGSAYSYRKYFGRQRPAFRSPQKIAEDLQKLSEQGVQLVFLSQDPRIGGRTYWRELLSTLQEERIQLKQLTMELFGPADEEYLRELAKIGVKIALTISPESGVDRVRMEHGRNYTNEELLETIDLCKKYQISLGSFSMIALAGDTEETVRETWQGWEQICSLHLKENTPVDYAFGPMILLDPGSLAFDFPSIHGYRVLFKTAEDYIHGMSLPSWHQWISYETKQLTKDQIIQLIIDSLEYSINLRERCGFFSKREADMARYCFVDVSKETISVVNDAMMMGDEQERMKKLRAYSEELERKLSA